MRPASGAPCALPQGKAKRLSKTRALCAARSRSAVRWMDDQRGGREVRTWSRPSALHRDGWGTWIRTKTNRVRVCCATVTPFPNGFPNNFNGLERCSEAERKPGRKSAPLASRPSTRSLPGLASAVICTCATGFSALAGTGNRHEGAASTSTKYRASRDGAVACRPRGGMRWSAPQKGAGQRADPRARLSPRT